MPHRHMKPFHRENKMPCRNYFFQACSNTHKLSIFTSFLLFLGSCPAHADNDLLTPTSSESTAVEEIRLPPTASRPDAQSRQEIRDADEAHAAPKSQGQSTTEGQAGASRTDGQAGASRTEGQAGASRTEGQAAQPAKVVFPTSIGGSEPEARTSQPDADGVETAAIQPSQRSREASMGSKSAVPGSVTYIHEPDFTGQYNRSLFQRLYSRGLKALRIRAYEEAKSALLEAIKEAKNYGSVSSQLILSRLALGDVYLGEDNNKEANELYSSCLESSRRAFGEFTAEHAHALYGLASVSFNQGKLARAEALAKEALRIRQKVFGPKAHDVGMSLVLLGRILGAQGWVDEAHSAIQTGLRVLEDEPGPRSLDYADALRQAALFYHANGKRNKSRECFEHSYSIEDKSVVLDQPARLAGLVRFRWEDGSPRAQEFQDADFPFKYMVSNSVRVAATIVDLWEVMGVLISVTNISDKKVELGLGTVSLTEQFEPRKPLVLLEPNTIDVRRRERTMWDLTYNRPWLANVQKTRTFRGFVPARGHDLWRGPNIFGIYGKWGGSQRILPPQKFFLQRSPEELEEQAQAVVEEDLYRSRNEGAIGLVPVPLEPFESRTGVLYYLHPRWENVLLKVPVGNAVFEFPFHLQRKRIPH
ncbi:MAG TPA: tetratricopeptide repeat protein [Candidatus Obscuribacterales bacterium]